MTYIPSNVGIQKQATSKALDVAGDVNIDSTTASTSSTTGALVIAGGLGIGGDLYIGGAVSFTSATFQNMTIKGIATYNPNVATSKILQSTVSTETNPRFYIDGTGKHFWGPGALSTTYDVDLSRTSAGVLSLTGSLSTSGGITSSGTGSFNSITSSTTLNVTGASTLGGNTTCSGSFIGSYSSQQTMLKSSISGSDKFVLDSSGYMTWGGTSLTLGANADADFNSNPVFSLLNSSGRVMLKNGTASIRSTSADAFTYAGSHTFTNGLTSQSGITSKGSITVKDSSTGSTSLVLNSSRSLDFYTSGGVLSTSLYADSSGLVTDNNMSCSVLNASAGVSTSTIATGTIVVNNQTMTIKNPTSGLSGCGINFTTAALPTATGFMGINSAGTGFDFQSPVSTGLFTLLNSTTAGANLSITAAGITASRTLTVPDSSGTILTDSSASSVSNKIIQDISQAYSATTIASGASVVVDPNNYSVLYVTSSSNSSIIGIKVPTFPVVTPSVSSVRTLKIINTSNTAITVVQDSPSALSAERIKLTVGLSSISPNGGSMVFTWSGALGQWYQDGSSANGYSFGRTEGSVYQDFTPMTVDVPTGSTCYNFRERDIYNDPISDIQIHDGGLIQSSNLVGTSLSPLQTVVRTFATVNQTLFVARYNGLYTIDITAYVSLYTAGTLNGFSALGVMVGDSTFSQNSRQFIPFRIMKAGVDNPGADLPYRAINRCNVSGQIYLRAGQNFCPGWQYNVEVSLGSTATLYCGAVTNVAGITYVPSYPAIRIFGQEI